MKRKLILITFVITFTCTFSANATWQGPTEVVVGSWGTLLGQFGFVKATPNDGFPTSFLIDKDNNVIIADILNKRVQVFKVGGDKIAFGYKGSDPGWEIQEWPTDKIGVYDNIFVEGGLVDFQFYDYQGNLIRHFDVIDCVLINVNDDGSLILQNHKTGIYYKYSSTGQLLQTYTKKPLELGMVRESRQSGKYKIIVEYLDKTYSLLLSGPYEKYVRDNKENINAIAGKEVRKFSLCGKELGVATMPQNQRQVIRPAGRGFEAREKVLEEYGSPVIAPNGDVYTWKRTPDKYSILKWTWVDDPNVPTGPDAPTGLTVIPSINGLYLTWTASPQDPGCVTGYEIARATSAGGVFSTVGTVEKGVIKYNDTTAAAGTMYYYKIRAIAGSEYSPYTSEVSGKR